MVRSLVRWGFRLVVLLLSAGFAALWVRSRSVNELVIFSMPRARYVEIATIPDQFRITLVDNWPLRVPLQVLPSKPLNLIWPVFGQGPIYAGRFVVGLGVTHGSRLISAPTWGPAGGPPTFVTYNELAVPFPLPVAVCAIVLLWPVVRLAVNQRRQRTRTASGHCPQCGYDLRASAQRCPECGALR
jgi:hypothetical protein